MARAVISPESADTPEVCDKSYAFSPRHAALEEWRFMPLRSKFLIFIDGARRASFFYIILRRRVDFDCWIIFLTNSPTTHSEMKRA